MILITELILQNCCQSAQYLLQIEVFSKSMHSVQDAGADASFVGAPRNIDELMQIGEQTKVFDVVPCSL